MGIRKQIIETRAAVELSKMLYNKPKFDLSTLCYRRVRNGIWMKPVGKVCFVYNENMQKWFCYFNGVDGKLYVYSSFTIELHSQDFERILLEKEAYAPISIDAGGDFKLNPENYGL